MGVLKIRSGGVWIPVAQSVGISSPGYVGHAVAGSSTPSVGATVTDVGVSVTFTAIAGRTYKTTVLSSRMDQFTTNSPGAFMGIYDGANAYKGGSYQALVAGGFGYINTFIIESNLSGSTTRKARTNTNAGVMNVQAGSVLLVEDITTATEGGLATAWTNVTFENGWLNYGGAYQTVQYRKLGDMVYLRGLAKGGTLGAVMFTLPIGFRPPLNVQYAVDNGAKFGMIDVQSNGSVIPNVSVTGANNLAYNVNGVAFSVMP